MEISNDKINIALEAMHNAGIGSRDIATITKSMDHSTICRRLKKLTPRKSSEIFRELRADVLSEVQRKILTRATTHIENARDCRDYATAFGVFYDKERLERGQSTENIGYLDYNRALDQITAEARKLAQELGIEDREEPVDV